MVNNIDNKKKIKELYTILGEKKISSAKKYKYLITRFREMLEYCETSLNKITDAIALYEDKKISLYKRNNIIKRESNKIIQTKQFLKATEDVVDKIWLNKKTGKKSSDNNYV